MYCVYIVFIYIVQDGVFFYQKVCDFGFLFFWFYQSIQYQWGLVVGVWGVYVDFKVNKEFDLLEIVFVYYVCQLYYWGRFIFIFEFYCCFEIVKNTCGVFQQIIYFFLIYKLDILMIVEICNLNYMVFKIWE